VTATAIVGDVRSTFKTTRNPLSSVARWTCSDNCAGAGGGAGGLGAGRSAGGAAGAGAVPDLPAGALTAPFWACFERGSFGFARRGRAVAVPATEATKGRARKSEKGIRRIGSFSSGTGLSTGYPGAKLTRGAFAKNRARSSRPRAQAGRRPRRVTQPPARRPRLTPISPIHLFGSERSHPRVGKGRKRCSSSRGRRSSESEKSAF
jgi:hypothetical protein